MRSEEAFRSKNFAATGLAIAQRSYEVLRWEGPMAFAFKALGDIGYRRMVLFEDAFDRTLDLPRAAVPLDVELLQRADVEAYLRIDRKASMGEIHKRLSEGQICAVGRVDGEISCCAWYEPRRARIAYLDLEIELSGRWVHGYGLLVRPELRRLGLAVDFIRRRRPLLTALGIPGEIAAVTPENIAGMAFERAARRRRIGVLRSWRLGRWRRYQLRLAPQCGAPVLRIAENLSKRYKDKCDRETE